MTATMTRPLPALDGKKISPEVQLQNLIKTVRDRGTALKNKNAGRSMANVIALAASSMTVNLYEVDDSATNEDKEAVKMAHDKMRGIASQQESAAKRARKVIYGAQLMLNAQTLSPEDYTPAEKKRLHTLWIVYNASDRKAEDKKALDRDLASIQLTAATRKTEADAAKAAQIEADEVATDSPDNLPTQD